MNRLIALALTSALLTTAAHAQTVTDEVAMQLWCGTAMTIAFSNPPEGVSADQLAAAQVYVEGGTELIAVAEQAHLDAGFTQEAIDKLKTDLIAEVTPVVAGTGEGAKYSFEDCLAILPGQTPADAPSSAQ